MLLRAAPVTHQGGFLFDRVVTGCYPVTAMSTDRKLIPDDSEERTDAIDHLADSGLCPSCDGTGQDEENGICPFCRGSGNV